MRFILAALLGVVTPLHGQEHSMMAPIPAIAVVARGEVKVSPDRASVQISVQTRASTAAVAGAENATKQKAVIDALRALGLLASDISTSNYNVYPEQRYEPNREPVIVGYNVTNTLTVEVKTLNLVGPVIDAALSKGVNMITSLNFYASNTETARREAIGMAVQKARADAEVAARAAGGVLGSLLEISIGAYFPQPPQPVQMRLRVEATAQAADTPINPGQQAVSVEVSTRWNFTAGQ